MTVSVRDWIFPIALTAVCSLIAMTGDAGRMALRYLGPESGLDSGDVSYRWLTGHYTHIGWRHVALNGAGILSIWALHGRVLRVSEWIFLFLMCPMGISLCLALFAPQITHYVGLSGVLHGMLAAAALIALFSPRQNGNPARFRWEEIVVLIGLWGKIIYEQTIGAVPMTAFISGDTVIVNAHLYGACIGTGLAMLRTAYK